MCLRVSLRRLNMPRANLRTNQQVEYLVVAVDEAAKKARLSLAQADILKSLAEDEALWKSGGSPRPQDKDQ